METDRYKSATLGSPIEEKKIPKKTNQEIYGDKMAKKQK